MLMDRSFTVKSVDGLLSSLATTCHVSQSSGPATGVRDCARIQFDALWDTGATKSVITPRVVEACGLKPIRSIKSVLLQGVNGLEKSEAYVVNIYLPDKITAREFTVLLKDPGDVWWDVIIGMDIISVGDFSIRNVNGKTEWSFSIPTKDRIYNERRLSKQGAS
jgi:predicted aspartyl protease